MRPKIETVIWQTSLGTGVSVDEILGPRRFGPVVVVRHEAMRIAYDEHSYTLMQIGAVFRRDHTTVHEGVHRARLRRDGLIPPQRSKSRGLYYHRVIQEAEAWRNRRRSS